LSRVTEVGMIEDPLTPHIDLTSTTFWDAITKVFADAYTPNELPTRFSGKICRVEHDPSKFNGNAQSQMFKEMNINNTQCKVWLEGGVYKIYCKPETFDNTPEDRCIINNLPDIPLAKEKFDGLVDRGQSVSVSSASSTNLEGLVVDYSYTEKSNGERSLGDATTNKPSSAFANKSPQP